MITVDWGALVVVYHTDALCSKRILPSILCSVHVCCFCHGVSCSLNTCFFFLLLFQHQVSNVHALVAYSSFVVLYFSHENLVGALSLRLGWISWCGSLG